MAGTIKHRFQSAVADAGEAGMLGPDEWNDSLVASGGTNGDLFLRNTVAADGWSLLASAAASQVLTSGGAGSAPSWSATPTLTSLTLSGLTANSFLYSGAAGALTTTAAPTNGQLLIGSTAAAPALSTITGTANRVTVTNGAGTITLSGPQDLATSSTVQFGSLGLGIAPTMTLDVVAGGVNQAHFGGVATHGLYLRGASGATHYNWLIGEQVNVAAALEITPSTAVGGTTFSTPVVVFQQNGNVGIGTTVPGTTVDAQGATGIIKVTSTTGTNTAQFSATNTGGAVILGREDSTGGTFGQAAYASVLFSGGAYPLVLGTNNASRIAISSTGSVTFSTAGPHAIGGVTSTSYQLNIAGTFTASGAATAAAVNVDTIVNSVAGQSTYGIRFTPNLVEASSGTHPTITGIVVLPTITNGLATTTDVVGIDIGAIAAATGTTTATSLRVAAPTGAATNYAINVTSGDIYKAGSAYTNPAWVFEHYYTGGIARFADRFGAAGYAGLPTLAETRAFTRERCELPQMARFREGGMFDRGDMLLASVEQSFLYLFEHDDRIERLERQVAALAAEVRALRVRHEDN